MFNAKKEKMAKKTFERYGNFVPTLQVNDDKFFVMDFENENGSKMGAIRYILDKENGDLMINGDFGYATASWFTNDITPTKLKSLLNDEHYFKSKIRSSSSPTVVREYEDVLEALKNQISLEVNIENEEIDDYLKRHNLDEELLTDLADKINREDYSEDFYKKLYLFEDYFGEVDYYKIGNRLNDKIYLWIYGCQKGIEMLEEEFEMNYGLKEKEGEEYGL